MERIEREVKNTRPASKSTECVEQYIQYPYAFMARTMTTVLMPSDMFCVYSQYISFYNLHSQTASRSLCC
jgi:hypothetical protein